MKNVETSLAPGRSEPQGLFQCLVEKASHLSRLGVLTFSFRPLEFSRQNLLPLRVVQVILAQIVRRMETVEVKPKLLASRLPLLLNER